MSHNQTLSFLSGDKRSDRRSQAVCPFIGSLRDKEEETWWFRWFSEASKKAEDVWMLVPFTQF